MKNFKSLIALAVLASLTFALNAHAYPVPEHVTGARTVASGTIAVQIHADMTSRATQIVVSPTCPQFDAAGNVINGGCQLVNIPALPAGMNYETTTMLPGHSWVWVVSFFGGTRQIQLFSAY